MSAIMELEDLVRARRSLPDPKMRKALRKAAGVSLEAVARACGVSREAARLWELGIVDPREENLRRYLEVLRLFQEGP